VCIAALCMLQPEMRWSVTGARTLRRLGLRSMPPYFAASCCSCTLSTSMRSVGRAPAQRRQLPEAWLGEVMAGGAAAGHSDPVHIESMAMQALAPPTAFTPIA